jgi:hypothetical protein
MNTDSGTNSEILRFRLKEWVLRLLGCALLSARGRSGFLARSFLGGLVIETMSAIDVYISRD